MKTIIVYPEDKEKLAVLKAFMKALNIRFEEAATYNTEFVEKIKRSEAQFEEANFKVIKTEDLWK